MKDEGVKIKGRKSSKVTNLIDEIRKYKEEKVELRGNMSKPLKDLMAQAQKQSKNTQANVPAPTRIFTPKVAAKVDYFGSNHTPI